MNEVIKPLKVNPYLGLFQKSAKVLLTFVSHMVFQLVWTNKHLFGGLGVGEGPKCGEDVRGCKAGNRHLEQFDLLHYD